MAEKPERLFCYDCRFNIRNENGIVFECAFPDKASVARCRVCASSEDRPYFEPKQKRK